MELRACELSIVLLKFDCCWFSFNLHYKRQFKAKIHLVPTTHPLEGHNMGINGITKTNDHRLKIQLLFETKHYSLPIHKPQPPFP